MFPRVPELRNYRQESLFHRREYMKVRSEGHFTDIGCAVDGHIAAWIRILVFDEKLTLARKGRRDPAELNSG